MRTTRNSTLAAITIGLLVLGTAGLAGAGDDHSKHGTSSKMALQGCLNQDANGDFTLVEIESGDSVRVEAPEDLRIEEHVGQTVKITGNWQEDKADYTMYFQAEKIEKLSDRCEM
ncbi:MAG TPA: hypothetical protein VLT32_01745 [Candidatus Sulfomarinibacteraceae bacterium]|nr:hypothetical protein [Candidatus Sulfomarinibacteraceae bacterium]